MLLDCKGTYDIDQKIKSYYTLVDNYIADTFMPTVWPDFILYIVCDRRNSHKSCIICN